MNLYPVMINLNDRRVVVIGGGLVAFRKVTDLLESGAHVRVIAPVIYEGFKELKKDYREKLELLDREYYPGDLKHAFLAFVATDDPDVNRDAWDEAESRNILINAVDNPPYCSFYLPSFSRSGDLILAVSTSGASPAMAARLRRELAMHLPEDIEDILSAMADVRELLKQDEALLYLTSEERGRFLKRVVSDDSLLKEIMEARKKGKLVKFLREIINTPVKGPQTGL